MTKASDMLELIYLRTKNDKNGNPRRLFASIICGGITRVYDEGYEGTNCVPESLRGLAKAASNYPIETTPGEYRRLKKLYS